MQELNDPQRIAFLRGCLAKALSEPDAIDVGFLTTQGWRAVPVESALHFDADDANRLAAAAISIRCHTAVAMPTEGIAKVPAFVLGLSAPDLLEFSRVGGHFSYLLIPENVEFLILCSVNDYVIVAGPLEFVETVLQKSIRVAELEFANFAKLSHWNDRGRRALQSIAQRYATRSA